MPGIAQLVNIDTRARCVRVFKYLYRKGHLTMGKFVLGLIIVVILALAILEMGFNLVEMRRSFKHAVSIQVCQMPDLPRANAVCEY